MTANGTNKQSKRPRLRFTSGESIKAYRRELGLNQTNFWQPIGVTQSGGCRYESGRSIPAPVQLVLHLTYGTEAEAERLLSWLRAQKEK
ncbi:MAG: helix-turn-helix domain-containing protein [Rhodocyclaceae bacterium]|nr:helix-turn-helix domain-containing protein [Rhodocyclaceae bacterium]